MTLDEVIGGTEALVHLDAAHDAAWTVTDPDLLAACRDRILEHLAPGGGATVDADRRAVDTDRVAPDLLAAALAFTDQYIFDVASVSDDQVTPLRDALGDQGLVDFLHALLVVEQRIRLSLIWDAVL